MANFWKVVRQVLGQSDIVIQVLDARFPDMTRNPEMESLALGMGKPIINAINKCDLARPQDLLPYRKSLSPCAFVSAKGHLGTTILRRLIKKTARKKHVTAAVAGYPNTGKSSLINAMAGRRKAKTSSISSYTRGMQKIAAGSGITLIDTPGVYPYRENDEDRHALLGVLDADKLKDPVSAACTLLEALGPSVRRHFEISEEDPDSFLEKLAAKLGRLRKGGQPDIESVSRIVVRVWQKGEIRL